MGLITRCARTQCSTAGPQDAARTGLDDRGARVASIQLPDTAKVGLDRVGKSKQYLRQVCPTTGPCETNFSPAKGSSTVSNGAIQQGSTHQVGHQVVLIDQHGGVVTSYDLPERFSRVSVVMDAEGYRSLIADSNLVCCMRAAVGKGETRARVATTSWPIAAISGRSTACWVPFEDTSPTVHSYMRNSLDRTFHSVEFVVVGGYTASSCRVLSARYLRERGEVGESDDDSLTEFEVF